MFRLLTLFLVFPLIALSQNIPTLPKPSGHFSVGRSQTETKNGERLLLWYPAVNHVKSGKLSEYAEPVVLAALIKSGYYDQSAETMKSWASVQTHSLDAAVPLRGRRPLIVFLPGAGVAGFQYTALAEEIASQGFFVAVVDYFSPLAPKRTYNEDDSDRMTNDMARSATQCIQELASDPHWSDRIKFDRLGAVGHSIGGAAAIAFAWMDHRVGATVDMDGAPFGDALHGASAPLLVLRSKPMYSETDLRKRGRTRKQWETMGEEVRRTWTSFRSKSKTKDLTIIFVKGAGHFSFSDAPFVMPDSITRFGGEMMDPNRGQEVIGTCVVEFLNDHLRRSNSSPSMCSSFKEIVSGISPEVQKTP